MRTSLWLLSLLFASPALAEPTLVGLARLPADTFRDGPTSGQFIEAANGKTPPFENRQPVQGVSSVIAGDEPGTYLALSDNGFGSKANSADYVLCVYEMTPDWEQQTVAWSLAFELSDPDGHVPWPIVAEADTYPDSDIAVPAAIREKRLLTGADFDVESMVRLPDGTFWLGDEFGPFLLHFSADGKLLKPPVELPGEGMHSPDHPTKDPATAKVQRSGGFEGLMRIQPLDDPSGSTLVAMLEKSGEFGPPTAFIYRPAVEGESGRWSDVATFYSLLKRANAIGEITLLGSAGGVVGVAIERDSEEADAASHKRLATFVLHKLANSTPFRTTAGDDAQAVVADLLDLADPQDLDGDGRDRFRFPYVTIESVVVVDERTVMVVNDNNYPFSDGRPEREGPDETEFILIRFDQPLAELGR